ncbi:capsid scaffold protein [Beluga whale alphaherpesvirus 1]|nr:capsid scaffold protein [Beluga whale alphaherpesvirus 1]ASW27081.1 capsid scaffold protein [Beluga whale alphaherpesvirus 1]
MSGQAPAGQVPSFPPLPPGDYVVVPTSQYNQLVLGQARTATAPPPPPFGPAFPGLAPAPPMAAPAYGAPYGFPPHPLEAQLMAIAGALADRGRGAGGGDVDAGPASERRGVKRRRQQLEDFGRREYEDAYYPGEGAHSPERPAHASSGKTLARLASAVSSLQQEMSQLRAYGAPPHLQPHCRGYPRPGYPPQGPAGFPAAAPPAAHPAQYAPAPPPQPAPEPVTHPPAPPPSDLPQDAAPTVDASAVAGLPGPGRAPDDAALFAAHIMSNRA